MNRKMFKDLYNEPIATTILYGGIEHYKEEGRESELQRVA